MANSNMTVAALGRPFTLGMLYDARKDELIPGLRLWDDDTLQQKISEVTKPYSAFEIIASDTIESRSSLLDVGASLEASFLSGLIEVAGSAKYLSDQKKFQNQSRVTCQYNATTNFKELSVVDLQMNTQQKDVIKKGFATHLVSGILYGANAFFVFDSEKLEASSVQDVQGSMEAVIKKIPSFSIQGKVDIQLTDEEKALTDKFSCKYYGDFILDSNPATFKDAVKTYVDLPQLLGEKGENSVPLKVWLMPLKCFAPEASELTKEISVGLVRKAEAALQDLREIGMRCSDSLVEKVVENFPQFQADLNRFQKLCDYYEYNLQQTMAKKFPLIRDGKEKESSVEQALDDRDKSPFSHGKLSKWLDQKEREINIVRSCVDTMQGVTIVKSQSELDREVLAPGVEHALCFVFTSLENADPGLDAMAKFLDSTETGSGKENQWYYSHEVITKMREKAECVHDLAEALKNNRRFRFLVAAFDNNKYTGATIYHYKDGILATDDFTKPDPPSVESIKDSSDLIWYATDLNLDPNTANYQLTLSKGNKMAAFGSRQNYPHHPERFDKQPQVLCKEGLTGRHYWEIEWSNTSNDSVYGIAGYKGVERQGTGPMTELGCNDISWVFGKRSDESKLKAWYDNKGWECPLPSTGVRRVGVYLDWPAGTVSYYRVSSNTLSHLYTFRKTFTEPVYPGIWASRSNNYVYLCPVE
ncbi:neoverrucotoxin subunit alpha-like [Chelmon rostratus]|uniref:neoverrucotoxin subunit alpha-like n=1 Tax=Chelmon rostratus TaxID=109905 RepID=UPI001BEC8075|nr:neoverrucotoxin subunit alpha-like [Chelmon rostratus]